MERLDKVIDLYLKMKTNYALVITGEWGKGKTYYYKNVIEPKVLKTDAGSTNKYKSLIVSLFGQKSIEDIQTDIFLALHNPFKSKTGKIATNITRVLAKGIMKVTNFEKYYDVISEAAVGVNKGDLINLEDTVLCLDDIERISDNLNIEELIGFINSLVENNGAKVILIINEDKVNNKEKYFQFKEKIVGNSIEFNPDILLSLTNIIESTFPEDNSYKKFLLEKKDFIIDVFGKGSTNLRTLNFIITYFKEIFSEIENKLTAEHQKILFSKTQEILLNLFKFSITISIEYKEGIILSKESRISYKERLGLDWSPNLIDFENIIQHTSAGEKKEVKGEKSYRQQFVEKYYDNKSPYFHPSIYNFLTGGDVFIYDLLVKELKEIYKINESDGEILPQDVVYQKLAYNSCIKLKDKENIALIRELLNYTDKGKYSLPNYVVIFYYATRFGNPLKYDLNKLEKRIIKGMHKGKKDYKYVSSLEMHFSIDLSGENGEYYRRVIAATVELNKQLLENEKKQSAEQLEKLYYSDFDAFCKQTLGNKGSFSYEPFLNHFKVNDMYSHLLIDNDKRLYFTEYLRERYRNNGSYSLSSEVDFLKKLQQKIATNRYVISGKNITGYFFSQLNKQLLVVIQKLETKN